MEDKRNGRKQDILLILGLFVLISMVGGLTYAFFNYTKTGSANTLRLGNISFDSEQNGIINLSNVFPMTAQQAANDDSENGILELHITGDTTYINGMEYLVTLEDVDLETSSGKNIPVSLLVTVEDGEGNTLGSSNINYYTARESKDASIYRIHDTTSISNGDRIIVGYIKAGETGIDEVVKIKAYFDADNILITDTDMNVEEEGYTNEVDTTGKVAVITDEWNSLFSEGISFKVKTEVNDGIWVIPLAGEALLSQMSSKTSCTAIATNNAGIGGSGDVTYYTGNSENCLTNYVWYSGKLWRIIAVYPDGTMKLVTENAMTTINWGTNVYFNNSYVDQWLSQEFLPTLYNYQNIIVQDAEWNVTMTEVTTDPYLETESTTINRTLGLLNAYEYKRAGENSSYLFTAQNFFLMNPANSSDERFVNNNGIRNAPITALFKAYSIYGIRPSIYLSSNVVFTNMNESDAGKRSNPYRVSGDKATGLSGELINDRLSGEYVKLTDSSNNELLYRIIGIENEKTKIVSTTYVTNTSTSSVSGHFGADANFKTPANNSETWDNQYWDNYLKDPTSNGWLSTLSSDTLSILDTGTYYLEYHTIGSDLTKSSYKSTICASGYDNNTSINNCTKISNNSLIYTGKVGLLRLGEMMAAQQLTTMHSNYYAIYKDMWLITPEYYDTTRYITYLNQVDGQNGINCYKASDCSRSVRPTLHLKPQVTITGGSGTVYDPYTLTLSNS